MLVESEVIDLLEGPKEEPTEPRGFEPHPQSPSASQSGVGVLSVDQRYYRVRIRISSECPDI